ncbi:DUF4185 domain-containing protein [Mycolicibacter sinensis]|nr:DUF4185 domain-containing protein [Mycolicibacter sinensis]
MAFPTLSELRAATWEHLRTSAAVWRSLGRTWESAFTEVHNSSLRPGGTDWTGSGAEAFQDRAYLDLVKIRHPVDITDTVAGIAERGADAQEGNRRSVLDTVDEVESDNFEVGEDWSVTDRITWYSSAAELEQRELEAQGHSDFLISKLIKLVGDEADISRNLTTATADLHRFNFGAEGEDGGTGDGQQPHVMLVDDVLRRGESRNLGPVAGTGADGGIPGIGAADLGEVVTLPNGQQVAIFGDSFAGNHMGADPHYPSVAVPVTFDDKGMPHFGQPLTGPDGSPNMLFPLPPQAAGTNSLPAGSIRMRDGTTYMMATGTKDLNPTGGSWLTKVTDNPAQGWQPIDGSWRPGDFAGGAQSQISGFQAADGNVYIAADSFDRSMPAGMYRVDPAHVTDRSAWQPWTGDGFGPPGGTTTPISPVKYGELSFQEVQGQPVLSGFNATTGATEVRVGASPAEIFGNDAATTVVARPGNWDHPLPGTYPQNYGGYILPGSTLDDMRLFVSQWDTRPASGGVPYTVKEFQVNANR